MRLGALAIGVVVAAFGAVVLSTNVFRPPPAAERLAGVDVAVAGYTIDPLPDRRHRLNLTIRVTSARDVDECLAFALDAPFASRRIVAVRATCVRPSAEAQQVDLLFEGLTEDDLRFPSHTLVWGIPGGRCGVVLEVFGVCVVDMAGTAAVELPRPSVLPSLLPIGSLVPLFPTFSFRP